MQHRGVSTTCALQCGPGAVKSVSWFVSRLCPGIPVESLTVYKTIPHPGIQGNLNSYYSQQVCGVSRELGRAGRRGASLLTLVLPSPAVPL